MYIAETAPTRLRGRLVTLYQLGIVLGILAAVFSNMQIQRMGDDAWNTAIGWRWMFLMGLFPSIVFGAMILSAPESPRRLIKMGRISEGLAVLAKINGFETANREAAEIQSSLLAEEGHLSELLTSFLRSLLLGIMLASFSQISGITAILSFLPDVLRTAGTASTLWMASYLGNQMFPVMMKHLGAAGTFWCFGSGALVTLICVWKLVPETKGRSLEDITRFWMETSVS
jgi:SP family arabinose:H+ symporter-like MFS transporter